MTSRKNLNRFAQSNPRPTVGEIRSSQRNDARPFNNGDVYLPNPTEEAPLDRRDPLTCEQKAYAFGFQPTGLDEAWQLIKGDSGAGKSAYRVAEIFQNLGGGGALLAATPYSQPIALATLRSSDQRPRFFQANLFSVGRLVQSGVAIPPLSLSEVTEFAAGIPAGTATTAGIAQFGVPTVSTTQFRIMVADESGQRYFDTDVIGTKSIILYGFGVTVFALIKADGYEIDRARGVNPSLGPGLIDQSVVGSRVIPMRTNYTSPIYNRTVTILSPGGLASMVVPIPPGARTVQAFVDPQIVIPGAYTVSFSDEDLLNTLPAPSAGRQGVIDIRVGTHSDIYEVPNSNSIHIVGAAGSPAKRWTFVFEVAP